MAFLYLKRKFTQDLLLDTVFPTSRSIVTPSPLHSKLAPDEGDLLQDPSYYRTIIGKLNFLTYSRPDLSYAIQTLS